MFKLYWSDKDPFGHLIPRISSLYEDVGNVTVKPKLEHEQMNPARQNIFYKNSNKVASDLP